MRLAFVLHHIHSLTDMPSSSPHRQPKQGEWASHKDPDVAPRHVDTKAPPDYRPTSIITFLGIAMAVAALLVAVLIPFGIGPFSQRVAAATPALPSLAQLIDQKSFNVLEQVLPPSEANATTVSG